MGDLARGGLGPTSLLALVIGVGSSCLQRREQRMFMLQLEFLVPCGAKSWGRYLGLTASLHGTLQRMRRFESWTSHSQALSGWRWRGFPGNQHAQRSTKKVDKEGKG